jgi:hypothetical protein
MQTPLVVWSLMTFFFSGVGFVLGDGMPLESHKQNPEEGQAFPWSWGDWPA